MNSELSDMFDLSEINWNECNVKSQKSLVKLVCDYYTETHLKSKEIARHFKLAPTTVVSYLKRGMKIGWCTYNPQDYYGYKVVSKAVTVLNINNNECHYFDSMSICKRIMRQTYGVKLKHEQIKKACESKTPYKGFIFEFVKQTIQN
jgi:predicted transcriptional regulator